MFLQGCLPCDNLPCGQLSATLWWGMFIEIVNALLWVVLKFTMLTGILEVAKHFGLSSGWWLLAHVFGGPSLQDCRRELALREQNPRRVNDERILSISSEATFP